LLCAIGAPQIATQARVGTSQLLRPLRGLGEVGAHALQLVRYSRKPIGPAGAYGFGSVQLRLHLSRDFCAVIVGHRPDCDANSD
jgi:hypothetical protein